GRPRPRCAAVPAAAAVDRAAGRGDSTGASQRAEAALAFEPAMATLEPHWVVHEASVEALFVRAFGGRIVQSSQCLAALKAAGIDPTLKLKPSYPATVYEQGMLILRQHLYGSLRDDEAYRQIGRETTAGFYRTLIGGALGAVIKLLK